jgi:two-component sensor histidine kinase
MAVASGVSSSHRLAALRQADLLDTGPEPFFDRLTALAAKLFETNTALLSLVDIDRQYFKSQCGLPQPFSQTLQTPLSHSFCKHVVETQEKLIVGDARIHPIVSTNPAVTDLGVIAYLGVPVRSRAGEVLGSFCVLDTKPRNWSDFDAGILADLAHIAEDEIHLREQSRAARTLASDNATLAREYHHRVKNALAVSAALVRLSARDVTSVDELVVRAGDRLMALARAHDSLITTDDHVDLGDLVARLLAPYCAPGAVADASGPAVALRQQQVTPVCLFVHELATNSAKYGAFRNLGKVAVRWTNGPSIQLRWSERLEGRVEASPAGFGSLLIETAARQLGGRSETSWLADGLEVTLEFPAR